MTLSSYCRKIQLRKWYDNNGRSVAVINELGDEGYFLSSGFFCQRRAIFKRFLQSELQQRPVKRKSVSFVSRSLLLVILELEKSCLFASVLSSCVRNTGWPDLSCIVRDCILKSAIRPLAYRRETAQRSIACSSIVTTCRPTRNILSACRCFLPGPPIIAWNNWRGWLINKSGTQSSTRGDKSAAINKVVPILVCLPVPSGLSSQTTLILIVSLTGLLRNTKVIRHIAAILTKTAFQIPNENIQSRCTI